MEKRKVKRIKRVMAIEIEGNYGMLTDLSQLGVFILPDVLPKKFDNLKLTLLTDSGQMIHLQASIVRIEEQPGEKGKFGLGMILNNPPAEYFHYLDSLQNIEETRDLSQSPMPEEEPALQAAQAAQAGQMQPAATAQPPGTNDEEALDSMLQFDDQVAPTAPPPNAEEEELESLLQSTATAKPAHPPKETDDDELSLDNLFVE